MIGDIHCTLQISRVNLLATDSCFGKLELLISWKPDPNHLSVSSSMSSPLTLPSSKFTFKLEFQWILGFHSCIDLICAKSGKISWVVQHPKIILQFPPNSIRCCGVGWFAMSGSEVAALSYLTSSGIRCNLNSRLTKLLPESRVLPQLMDNRHDNQLMYNWNQLMYNWHDNVFTTSLWMFTDTSL